ncbi:hypothetical protein HAX54_021872, partial [Datura stramonium]|nr:hypothetical protein [Datura stramonium]
EELLIIRIAYGAINLLWGYDVAYAYGAIDFLRSYDAAITHVNHITTFGDMVWITSYRITCRAIKCPKGLDLSLRDHVGVFYKLLLCQ